MPLISVVLPVYNCQNYIEEAVHSILNQTISDFELIIIDDASTDETLTIINNLKDPRIKIVTKDQNLGLIHSLNLAFELSKGKFIARMDGDDISVPNRFEKQLDILENNSDVIVCGSWMQHFGKSEITVKHKENHNEIVAQMLLHCSLNMGTTMFYREILIANKFDESKKHVEDYDFWSRVAWIGKFYNIQEVLYYYRVHEMQVSSIYKQIQVQGDLPIKLYLFKKIGYNTTKYKDAFIVKMILLNQSIDLKELELFLNWIKKLSYLNRKTNVFSQKELEKVLKKIKRKLLFSLYFNHTNIGITKKWRIKALFKLPLQDALYILKIKSRIIRKGMLKGL